MGVNVYPAASGGGGGAQSPVYSFNISPNKKYTTTNCNSAATYYISVYGNKGVTPNAENSTPTVYANITLLRNNDTVPYPVQIEQDKPYVIDGTIQEIFVINCGDDSVISITKASTLAPSNTTTVPSMAGNTGSQIKPLEFYEMWASWLYIQQKGQCYSYDDAQIYTIGRNGYFTRYTLSLNSYTNLTTLNMPGGSDLEVAALYDTSGQFLYGIFANSGNSTWYFYTYSKFTNTWTQRTSWTDSTVTSSTDGYGVGARNSGYNLAYNGYLIGTKFFMPEVLGLNYIETSTWVRTAMASNTVASTWPRGCNTAYVNGIIYYSPTSNVNASGTFDPNNQQSLGRYNPTTNTWTNVAFPSYSILGGAIFKWSSTEIAMVGSAPIQSNATNALNYATNNVPLLYTYNGTSWTAYNLPQLKSYIPIYAYPGSISPRYAIYQRPTSTYEKTFFVYLSQIKHTNTGWNYRGAYMSGAFVDFRNLNTEKLKVKVLTQDVVRPLVLPGQKYCLAAGHTGYKNEELVNSTTYGLWGPWGISTTNYGQYTQSGILAVSADGSFVKNIAPDVQVIAGCYDIINGGSWYFYVYFMENEVEAYSTGPSYLSSYSTRSGFIRVNESDLSVDILSKTAAFGGSNTPGITGGTYYPQGLCWVFNGMMFLMTGSSAGASGSGIDISVYDMHQNTTVSFPYGSGSFSTVNVFNNTNDYLPIGSTSSSTYFGPSLYRYSTWVGWMPGTNQIPDGTITSPIPMFWNGKDLWHPNSLSGASASYPVVSFNAGGYVGNRPPSVYKDFNTGRVTCETSSGFIDFEPVSNSTKPAYVFPAAGISANVIKAQSYRGNGGANTYSQQWASRTYDFNGEEYTQFSSIYGMATPKAMMGNVQLNFGAIAMFNLSNTSTYYGAYIDNNITRMVV